MSVVDDKIKVIDSVITRNIDHYHNDRPLMSQNILQQLRTFVEHISLKIYNDHHSANLTPEYDKFQLANKYVRSRGELRFLYKLYNYLQASKSHYTSTDHNAESLMIKYFTILIDIKNFMKSKYDMDILENLEQFPLEQDETYTEYYNKVVNKINTCDKRPSKFKEGRYYIKKKKPFIIDGKTYYEITLSNATDYVSKFNRVIAFTEYNILTNYAIKVNLTDVETDILDRKLDIKIITDWKVSIRPCELNNYIKLLGKSVNIQSSYNEYVNLMQYLTEKKLSLVDILEMSDDLYSDTRKRINHNANSSHIFDAMDKTRWLVIDNKNGSNVLKYLLLNLNNKILKAQYHFESQSLLSYLNMKLGCIPFDKMPYATSLIAHNPRFFDLIECIDTSNRSHELLGRIIMTNTEQKGKLYTPIEELEDFNDVEVLINRFNSSLYHKHINRRLILEKNHVYIKGYEDDIIDIINKLKEKSKEEVENYRSAVDDWLDDGPQKIDSSEKREIMLNMFEHSRLAMIYGSAGTGKTTLINYIASFFKDSDILFLANTHPAVQNLKRRVDSHISEFMTIAKYLSNQHQPKYDILIIDECSTVSNRDMRRLLDAIDCKLLVVVGDVYQIESITFGNWFSLAQKLVSSHSIHELSLQYRSDNEHLLEFWDKVRRLDNELSEYIARYGYSHPLNERIFDSYKNDEIILCLNYDGLYGINNINRYLQANNPNQSYEWELNTYKMEDPILFNDTQRFSPLLHNNLKGRIVNIIKYSYKIQFDIEVDKAIHSIEADDYDFQLINSKNSNKSIVRFDVFQHVDSDEDDDASKNVVPFQIAYAVSIHKAQGLEYDSVKIIITKEIEEMITHNIFYTAITRAKETLNIYWSSECQENVLANMKTIYNEKDVHLISHKI